MVPTSRAVTTKSCTGLSPIAASITLSFSDAIGWRIKANSLDPYERQKKSDCIAVWCAEQIAGKAPQPLTGPDGGPVQIQGV